MNVIILDSTLQQVSLLSSFVSLTFNKQFNDCGGFEIAVNLNTLNAEELMVDRLIYIDSNRCGVIERIEITRETNKSAEILVASGIEVKDLTSRRITIPPSGSARDEYTSQTTETIARSLLTKHIISPVNTDRQMSIFTLGSINSIGASKDFSTRYKPLDGELYSLIQEDGLGLSYEVDLFSKSIALEVVEGLDRTKDQTTNPTAIFALKLGTANRNVILQDKQSLKNRVYVAGQGEGTARTIVILSTGTPSGVDLRESLKDARDVATTNELTTRGNASLKELGSVYEVNSIVNNSANINYDLGDLVTLLDYRSGDCENLQVTGIIDAYAGSAPRQRTILFGRAPLSVAQAINSRLSGVNNILTQ